MSINWISLKNYLNPNVTGQTVSRCFCFQFVQLFSLVEMDELGEGGEANKGV